MVLTIRPDRARWASRVRLAALALVTLQAAHTAIYAVHFGLGRNFALAMSEGGHDGWWIPASLLVGAAGVTLFLRTAGALTRLERAAGRFRHAPDRGGRSSYAPTLLGIWRVLMPLVIVLFTAQENLEQLASGGRVPGPSVLINADLPLTLPALALVTLAMAAVGALVRWRVATLAARIRRASARRVATAAAAAARWRAIGDLVPRAWMADRLDAGRAPPARLRI